MVLRSEGARGITLCSNPLCAASIYVLFGGFWVLLADEFLGFLPIGVNRVIFILLTAGFLYFIVHTNRGAIEAAKRDSTARIEGYFRSAAEGLIVVGNDGRIVEANAKIEQMFGYKAGELIGQPVETLMPDRFAGKHLVERANFMKAPRSRPMGIGLDLAARRKDGSEFPVEISLSYVPTGNGGLVTAFVTDITERRNMEFQTRRNESMAAIGTVAAGVAHELNNPLAIISTRAELVMTEAAAQELPEQLRRDLEVIHRNAQRASRLATEMLTLARQPQKMRKPLDLNNLVSDTLLLFRAQASRDGIRIETELNQNRPQIMGDLTALSQVLINLLINARDAMPEGGTIRVATEAVPDKPEQVRLVVADTGKGIPQESLDRIFDLFFTTKTTGTGLGLWLAKRTVREHGGAIEVASEPGKGTTFTLTFLAMPGELVTQHAQS